MATQVIAFKVAGITFEGRQDILAKLTGREPIRLIPELSNPYDKNTIGVNVAFEGEIRHVGYVPKDQASRLAEHLEGEELMGEIVQITGGFTKSDGETSSLGLIVRIEIPYDTTTDS